MANIDVERKPRSVWPWALVLLVVLLLIWLAWNTLARTPTETDVVMTPVGVEGDEMVMRQAPATPASEVAGVTGGSVNRFVAACGSRPSGQVPAEGAGYELACLRELTNAIAGLVLADTAGSRQLDDELRQLRRQIQTAERDRLTLQNDAARVGEIASRAAELMAALQSTRAPSADPPLAAARESAHGLRAGPPADRARQMVDDFFEASARVLQTLESAGS